MKALERRQALIETLCKRRHDKVCNLAFEFGVNERTIRRDIEQLSLSFPSIRIAHETKQGFTFKKAII